MYPHQAERLTQTLERHGLEALIATTAANVAYVTGFSSLAKEVYRTASFAVFTRGGTALCVPAIDLAPIVVDAVAVDQVVAFGGFVSSYAEAPDTAAQRIRALAEARAATPADALAAALEAVGVSAGTVALDEGHITPQAWQRVVARLSGYTVVPAFDHFLAARRIKGPWELECLQRALAIVEEAANAVVQMLRPGVTEQEAVRFFQQATLQRGGTPYGAIVAFVERAAIPAPSPSDRALRSRDLVRLDFGCVHRGYCAEVARTAVMGQPGPRASRAADAILTGLEAAIGRIAPGVTAGDIHATAVGATREAGLPGFTRYHVGHGIGLEPYERPKLNAGNSTPLEAGDVLRVETPYYEHGWSGLSIKDTVLVTTTGARALNRSARGLVVLD